MVYFHIVYLEWLRKPTKNLRQYSRCHNRDSQQAPAEYYHQHKRGRDSAVGIATRYGLDGPVIESPWKRDFPHLSSWGPPSLLYNGYRVSFPGVKRPGRGVDNPVPSSAEVKERVQLYLYSPSGPSWPIQMFRSHRISGKRRWAFRFCLCSTACHQATACILMFLDSSFHLDQVSNSYRVDIILYKDTKEEIRKCQLWSPRKPWNLNLPCESILQQMLHRTIKRR